MLSSESLEIGEMFREAMQARFGAAELPQRFRAFDTICSATQERQDAVESLLDSEHVDLMLVVGGYNSSNTCNLARICAARVRTYHISDPSCLLAAERIRHRPVGAPSTAKASEVVSDSWLPATGPIVVGLTLGLAFPWFMARQKAFLLAHHALGTTRFGCDVSAREFFGIYILGFIILLALVVPAAVLMGFAAASQALPEAFSWIAF